MTLYYGVIGNRDYIKLHGEKLPYWHFLDEQPDGWLTSLVYKRKDVPPGKHMIWDCGAWSYREKETPDYTPETALAAYQQFAPHGSRLIAPDHMLIPGADLDARRAFNLRSAAEFLKIIPAGYEAMACVHGMGLDERVAHAKNLVSMGYQHLAVGGVAARASQKNAVIEIVSELRDATAGATLHVLGLSSPEYMRQWRRIGVDSCDGSSHFKQAFTGGAFFTQHGAKLTKHQAARPGNPDCEGIVAPSCDCRACTLLREDGVDTRTFGSNEHNMGRAAHNQNMLMRAQMEATRKNLVLVACSGAKLPHGSPAADLYQSALFKKSRAWAEANGDEWAILSAFHGVTRPDAYIHPYDRTLSGAPAKQRAEWAELVTLQLETFNLRNTDTITVLAGNDYCDWVPKVPYQVHRPMQGLGIGQQLAWLNNNTDTTQQGELF